MSRDSKNHDNSLIGHLDSRLSGMKMGQLTAQTKFAWTLTVLQIAFGAAYFLMVRYADSADAKHVDNQLHKDEHLEENLRKYPSIMDIHMMLIGGFGFLMTFMKRYSFTSLGLTFIVILFTTEWTILINGFVNVDPETFTIAIDLKSVLEGGFAAATVMISVGGVFGKINPFQALIMCLIEAPLFVLNGYIGYQILGVVDVGGAMFIHMFGAYFGLATSMMARKRNLTSSEEYQESRYTSDIFSLVGTVLLWIYWPSFNAVLANDDGFHRAIINTYISLIASTLATFAVSSFFGE